jgi:hypothetical protein
MFWQYLMLNLQAGEGSWPLVSKQRAVAAMCNACNDLISNRYKAAKDVFQD